MKEKAITCIQCGDTFIFSIKEQERFSALGFGKPKRCRECRKKKAKDAPSRHQVKLERKRVRSRRQWENVFE